MMALDIKFHNRQLENSQMFENQTRLLNNTFNVKSDWIL